ncbi:MAG: Asp-tRNA(Asn)/Glu-tRNA(Gln) amidotransferase subunit GatA [Candidatus Eremiobacteraeota bacterium]|nr:Asp-tRNA(Asn)/Glu-tRNA(Gln) amidotransferase subunit GatA [Candidatus Eremiobacteraeota bacterium]
MKGRYKLNPINLTAHEAHEKMVSGEISSTELTKACLQRISMVEKKVSAYITIFPDLALKMAKDADERLKSGENVKPLTGIPIALKDLLCMKGKPTTCGSKILENFVPPYNATVVDMLLDAGAIILGKTNMDEFAMGSSTENSAFFPTHNPWDPDRVPGGSSGGSAAAVAAGEAIIALGSDTGGSIRQPAAFCGVTGMKPTYGAVSRYGLIAFASSLDQIGPIARDVKDIALCLDAIVAHDPMDSTSISFKKPPYLESLVDVDIKGMKIGYPVDFFGEGLDPGIRKSLDEARRVLEGLGAEFVDVELKSGDYALAAYYIIAPSEASSNLARYDGARYGYRNPTNIDVMDMYKKTRGEGLGREVIRRIMTGTYALSSGYYDAYYLKAQKVRTLIRRDYDRSFEKCDLLFTPATPAPAFRIGEKVDDPLEMYLSDIYTVSVNLAGLPGLVVPCGFTKGLPVGLQLIGKSFDELTLLKVGNAFQEVTDYHKRSPVLD